MSLVLRYVVVNTENEKVADNVIGFIPVHDQNGSGLIYSLVAAVDELGLNISHCMGSRI
jgi:hypothetical protein